MIYIYIYKIYTLYIYTQAFIYIQYIHIYILCIYVQAFIQFIQALSSTALFPQDSVSLLFAQLVGSMGGALW